MGRYRRMRWGGELSCPRTLNLIRARNETIVRVRESEAQLRWLRLRVAVLEMWRHPASAVT